MKLNGQPITVDEFTLMDETVSYQIGKLMESGSPTFILLCAWIVERREQPKLTWQAFKQRPFDLEALSKSLRIEDADPMNGSEPGVTLASADIGDSALSNSMS